MNKPDQNLPHDERRLIDLLVDGELADGERRQLLASFDAQPDGWRRCALAFLESQSWGRELRALARPDQRGRAQLSPLAGEGRVRGPMVLAVRPWWQVSPTGMPLAMAATFLLAFGLAWVIRQPALGPGAVDEARVTAPAIGALADAGAPTNNAVATDTAPAGDRWDTVTLVMDDGASGKQEVQLPVVESASADDSWLDRAAPVVPRELRDALERLGHRVDERRQFLPVDLEDGRQLIVPVDDVEFTPVQARVYQ